MSFKNNFPFDRSQGRNRSVVGQYLTRDQQPAESAAMHLLRLAHEEASRVQSLGPPTPAAASGHAGQVADTPAMERLTDAVAHARRALPFVEHAPGRDLDRTLRIPMPAARMVTLDIGADHLPVFDAPSGNQPSEAMTLAESLLTHARTLQAGAHLLIEPKGRVIETGTGVPALQVVPMGLEVVRAAPFAVVTDPDGDLDPENPGTVALTPLASVLVGDRIDRPDDLKNYVFRVSLTRREQKDRRDGELLAALLHAITLGLAQAADAELLGAILAADPGVFSLGAAAAKGVRFHELRAIVGTDEALNGSDFGPGYGDQAGRLFVHSIPAELCAAADRTVIGAFDRFGLAIGGELRLLIDRTAGDGSLTATCWCAMKAVLPDPGFAWRFTPVMP